MITLTNKNYNEYKNLIHEYKDFILDIAFDEYDTLFKDFNSFEYEYKNKNILFDNVELKLKFKFEWDYHFNMHLSDRLENAVQHEALNEILKYRELKYLLNNKIV